MTQETERTQMQTIQTQGHPRGSVAANLFDEDGYLIDQTLWSGQLAQQIAREEDIDELTSDHWMVIEHIREKFFRLGALPNMRRVCKATSLSRAQVHLLFGGCRSIWRISGLPNPGEEAKAYLI